MVPRSGNGVGGGVISLFKGQIWSQARYIETNVPGEKNVLLKALAHSKDVATLKKYLNMTLGNQVACHVKLTQFWIRGRWRTKMCPQSLKQLQPTLLVCPRHFCLQFFSSVECSLRSYLSATNTIGKTSHNHFLNFFYNSTVWQCHNGDWSHPFLASSPFYKKKRPIQKAPTSPCQGATLAWEHLRKHWAHLFSLFGSSRTMGDIINSVTRRFSTSTDLAQMQKFFNGRDAGAGDPVLRQTIETVQVIAWSAFW